MSEVSNTPMRFRKRPGEVEAMQMTEDNWGAILSWATRFQLGDPVEQGITGLIVNTLHGPTGAKVGDWIIKGPHGDFWPCDPVVFESTYEAVDA